MDELKEKIEKVKMGLYLCHAVGVNGACNSCPYEELHDCEQALYKDTLAVITAFSDHYGVEKVVQGSKTESAPHNEKIQKNLPEIAKRFITLTRWTDSRTIAVNIDDIRYIEDTSNHIESLIHFKELKDDPILVKETIIDILEKISKGDGK